jgi:hypothetical protein
VPGPERSCGTATYPTIPASGTGGITYQGVFHVNAAYRGVSDGSAAKPYRTISDAVSDIPANHTYALVVAAGDYDEAVTIGQHGEGAHLFCRCPEQVRIRQTMRMSALSNASLRVVVDGCSLVPPGVDPETSCQWPAATCSHAHGIEAVGGQAELHLLVRHSVIAGWCSGIYYSAEPLLGLDSSLCVARSRVALNRMGVEVIRAPAAHLVSSPFAECQGLSENLSLVLNRIDHNRGEGYGVYLGDTQSAVISANVVRDNQNRGIGLRNEAWAALSVKVQDNVVTGNAGAGIAMQKMQASLDVYVTGNVVAGTIPLSPRLATPDERGGDGLQVSLDNTPMLYGADVSGNTIDTSTRIGAFFDGVDGTFQNNTVTNSGTYGCVLQQSALTVGANSFSGNLSGDVQNYGSPVEKYGSLPIPMP